MSSLARRWIVTLAAVAAALGTARLGWWQLDRAGQKEQLQAAMQQRRALPALAGSELTADADAATAQHHRAVLLRGRWAAAQTIYLDNRQMNARPGFFVLTPLLLDAGRAVVVQRGFVARDNNERTRITLPPLPSGDVEVAGRIAPPPARLYEFEGAASGPIRQNLDLQAFARETGLPLLPLSVVQERDTPGDGLQRQWPQPAAGVHKHYGYAFQWFALCALILGLYVWFQLLRPRRAR